jgi:starch synthase
VLVTPGNDPFPNGRVNWIPMTPPLGVRQLRWLRTRAVADIATRLQPDVVIERYYNFGGEGISAAASVGAKAVLEVNAPVVDHPGSSKGWIDRALVVEPMRRWRERLCERADLIVTPSAAILPPDTPARKIVRLEWGADTDRFTPDAAGPLPFERPSATVAIFAGAFRSWHGAINLVRAMRELHARGRTDIGAVLIGEGPEQPTVRAEAHGLANVVIPGAIPHADVPACLAASDIGVAPFDMAAYRPLALGFFWSPLKIFEYMATGLPVVAPAVDRIPSLVEHGREGLLYDPAVSGALASSIERLTDPEIRRRLGSAARERAVREYSWRAHCEALDSAIRTLRR